MPLVINTNVGSLNAQRNLVKSGMDLSRSMERLASGLRINKAADDAAGLAISNRMTSQVRGLNQAVRNANDGISMIQTAEGALSETTNILQRMRELAIQSANGVFTDSDRQTLDAEVQQLVAELDRIADTTSFNGQTLLDGSLGQVDLQVGSESNQTISIEVQAMDSKTLGLGSTSADVAGTNFDQALSATTVNDGDILINGQSIGAFDGGTDNLDDLLANINENVSGVTATAFNEVSATTSGNGITSSSATLTITLTNPDSTSSVYTIQDTNSLAELATAINEQTGGTVAASVSDDGNLVISNNNGATIALGGTATLADVAGTIDATSQGQIALSADNGQDIEITQSASAAAGLLGNLGFQSTSANGEVYATDTLNSTALAAGDLVINGVAIDHTDTDSVQGKVDNINAATGETGVIASLKGENISSADATTVVAEVTFTAAAGALTAAAELFINGVEINFSIGDDSATVAAAVTAADNGVIAYVDDNDILHFSSNGSISLADSGGEFSGAYGTTSVGADFTTPVTETATTGFVNESTIRLNGTEVTLTAGGTVASAITAINAVQGTTGVHASLNDQGEMVLDSDAAFTVEAGDTKGDSALNVLGFTDVLGQADRSVTYAAHLNLQSISGTPISVEVTTAGATQTGLLSQNEPSSGAGFGSSISSISVGTSTNAQKAIDVIDNALTTINDVRSDLGAANNRLDFTISNLMNISENTTAARSRIMDADFAAETAQLSRAQVLQQASSAMLAQANAAPQQVLSLLR